MRTTINQIIVFILAIVFISISNNGISQGVSINKNGNSPDPSAILDLNSAQGTPYQGLLVPRLTTSQRDSIVSPVTSLLIYNTTTNCFEFYAYGIWQQGMCATCPLPASPTTGVHTSSQTDITWNWNSVAGATGYKYNTINDYATATDNGASTTYTKTGLTCNTSYTIYIWAYNTCGNSTLSTTLTQSTAACPFTCGNTFTDPRDSKTYTTVLIGSQCWFKQNLNYGNQINSNVNSSNNSYPEKYCYDDNSSNCSTYGALYQWNEVMDWTTTAGGKGLCPTGWHIPTNAEWATVISTNLSALQSQNSGVLCNGGNCGGNIYYANLGAYGYYWTSSEYSTSESYRRVMLGSSLHQSDYINKLMGLSMRCVMD